MPYNAAKKNEIAFLDYILDTVEQHDQQIFTAQSTGHDDIRAFTHHSALAKANKMAAYLSSLKLPPNSRIGIYFKSCVWWTIADLAIQMSGHETVPISPTSTKETITHILRDSEIRLLFIDSKDNTLCRETGNRFVFGIPTDSYLRFHTLKDTGKSWDVITGNSETEQGKGYGTTESTKYSRTLRQNTGIFSSVGTESNGVKYCMSSENDEPQMEMPGRMIGYYKYEATHDVEENGWARLGKNGKIHQDGSLDITGLMKEIYAVSEDEYVTLAPIESLLINHPLVELAVIGRRGYPQPFAIIQLAEMPNNNVVENGVLSLRWREEYSKELRTHLESIVNPSLDKHERLQFLVIVQNIQQLITEEEYAPLVDVWCDRKQKVIWYRLDNANAAERDTAAAAALLEEQALTYHPVTVQETSKFDEFGGIKFDEGIVAC